jgi:Heterokaryon incompatibility protein (HET)
MWLINVKTLDIELILDQNVPEYAILSHTWGKDELTFQDVNKKGALASWPQDHTALQKILFTCREAEKQGLSYAWVDTCCIDKRSSAELSEAINSMYEWYQNSSICYVHLEDVSAAQFETEFDKSRWFTRGWSEWFCRIDGFISTNTVTALQELIAPRSVVFFDKSWETVGSKADMHQHLAKITGVHDHLLSHEWPLSRFSVAQRMSWASNRETSRQEDIAYCLFGIFGINMPLLYGEGAKNAFIRLQKEILTSNLCHDLSILAWGFQPYALDGNDNMELKQSYTGILSDSPERFRNCRNMSLVDPHQKRPTLNGTNMDVLLPLSKCKRLGKVSGDDLFCALLPCTLLGRHELVTVMLRGKNSIYRRCECTFRSRGSVNTGHSFLAPDSFALDAVSETITISGPETRYAEPGYTIFRRSIVISQRQFEDFGWKLSGFFTCYNSKKYDEKFFDSSLTFEKQLGFETVTYVAPFNYWHAELVFTFEHQLGHKLGIYVSTAPSAAAHGGRFDREAIGMVVSKDFTIPPVATSKRYFTHVPVQCPKMANNTVNVNLAGLNLASVSVKAHKKKIFGREIVVLDVEKQNGKTDNTDSSFCMANIKPSYCNEGWYWETMLRLF